MRTDDGRRGSASLAWRLCLAAAGMRRASALPSHAARYALGRDGRLAAPAGDTQPASIEWRPDSGWHALGAWQREARSLFDLYLPLCAARPHRPLAVAHLGQSIDGRIATEAGDSRYVNAHENLVHLHRMRALCDAVVVGAGTVAHDDPRLTTRLVSGEHPVRVVIDPQLRLARDARVFTEPESKTLLACDGTLADPARSPVDAGDTIALPAAADGGAGLDLRVLLAALHARGLRVVFVEGGGLTVSRFVAQGCVDRLQITVAPVIVGAGRAGLQLPGAAAMRDCARPPYRLHRMGSDVLWDFDLRASGSPWG
ncbi:MAG: RibD family protein [Burkholderiaceae bacterium]|nr:RibD family protein [Burkholderiaceae bacterium]